MCAAHRPALPLVFQCEIPCGLWQAWVSTGRAPLAPGGAPRKTAAPRDLTSWTGLGVLSPVEDRKQDPGRGHRGCRRVGIPADLPAFWTTESMVPGPLGAEPRVGEPWTSSSPCCGSSGPGDTGQAPRVWPLMQPLGVAEAAPPAALLCPARHSRQSHWGRGAVLQP